MPEDQLNSPDTTTQVPTGADEIVRDPSHREVRPGDLLLELVPVPVTDVDRAKEFYAGRLGFHVDVDVEPVPGVRILQLTPPGSACSIVIGRGAQQLGGEPGTLRALHLVVADIGASREALIRNGVEVDEIADVGGGVLVAGLADPDGNTWLLQHMPWR